MRRILSFENWEQSDITPAAGFISPTSALLLGALAAFPSYYAILFRSRTRLDDSLDVVAAHGAGGTAARRNGWRPTAARR